MPEALSRNALLSFRWSSLHCLGNEAQQVLRDLGIARELGMGLEVSPLVKRPTSRGVRAGQSKSKQRALMKFLPFSLVNARSIPKRSNVISHHIISNDLEFLAVTETWLSSDHGDDDLLNVCPAGYNAVHTPRVGKRGGGVALIYRSSLRVETASTGFSASSFEHMAVRLHCNSTCIHLVIIYRPPPQSSRCSDGQFLTDFADFLQLLMISPGKMLMVGDFNIHIDNPGNPTANKFQSLLNSFGLCQHVYGATHLDGHTLDLVITRDSENVITSCKVSELICDHFAVKSNVKVHRPVRPTKKITYRELNRIDPDRFLSDMLSLPLFASPSPIIDGLLSQYNGDLSSLLDAHAPVRTKMVVIRPANPWLSEEVLAARREARAGERRWRNRKRSGVALEVDRQIVRELNKKKRRLLDREKVAYLNREIAKASGKQSLFKVVDSFLLKKPDSKLPRHGSLQDLVGRFSNHFCKKVTDIRSALDAARNCHPAADVPVNVTPFSSFESVSVSEIVSLIKACPSKSSLRDPIPTPLLKNYADFLAVPITSIVNLSISRGVFPDEMKIAYVTPILKKPSLCPEDLNNYRPVSLLSFLSKLVERVICRQLTSHLIKCNLYVPVQSAYRSDHSTETALLKVVNDLLIALDDGDATVLTLLDQSAAFDTVDHGILLHRLSALFGLSGSVLSWFESYLTGRLQSVCISGVCSASVLLLFGVPQGSVLGPVLFTLYNSPIHSISIRHGVTDHLYSDDVQMYKTFKLDPDHTDQQRAFSSISSCVGETKQWMTENLIKFNESKSDALVVHSKSSRCEPAVLPLIIGESPILPSDSVRNLGVILDKHLTMQQQIGSVCRTSFYHLRRITRIRKFLSRPAAAQLVSAFVLSHIDYGNSLLAGLPASRLYSLQKAQNAAARVVTGARRRDPMTSHLRDLHWLPISYRIDFKIAVLTFRCLNGCAPSYLSSLLSRRNTANPSGRLLRSSVAPSAHLDLVPPSVRVKTHGLRAFSNYAPIVWNKLPTEIRSMSTLSNFRKALKTHFYRDAFNIRA